MLALLLEVMWGRLLVVMLAPGLEVGLVTVMDDQWGGVSADLLGIVSVQVSGTA